MSREAIWQFELDHAERSAVSRREIAEEEQEHWLAARDEFEERRHRGARDSALKQAEEHERAAEELREKIRSCEHERLIVARSLGRWRAMCELCGKAVEKEGSFARFCLLMWRAFCWETRGER
jgi:hypothetical protein